MFHPPIPSFLALSTSFPWEVPCSSVTALFGDVRRVEVDEAIAAIAFGLEVHGQIEKVEPQLSRDVAICAKFSDVR